MTTLYRRHMVTVCATLGLTLLALGLLMLAREHEELTALDAWAQTYAFATFDESGRGDARRIAPNWEALRNSSSCVCALMSIESAGITLPVCQATPDAPHWYLSHDLWGNTSPLGSPFVDWRCRADASQVLVYGHRTSAGGMFSPLSSCWQQQQFDEVLASGLVWSTPSGGTRHLRALCALRTDQCDEAIQSFNLDGNNLREWLGQQCGRSSARAKGWETLLREAQSSIVLITCSSFLPGMPERTAVLFVCPAGCVRGQAA